MKYSLLLWVALLVGCGGSLTERYTIYVGDSADRIINEGLKIGYIPIKAEILVGDPKGGITVTFTDTIHITTLTFDHEGKLVSGKNLPQNIHIAEHSIKM